MASRNYAYQYETSPRKIKPEYNKTPKKKKTNTKTTNKKRETRQEKSVKKREQEALKDQKKLALKTKISVCFKCIILFAIVFLILFRNSQISEQFSKIQSLKSDITKIQKENDQLEIAIQNSLNLNNIEQAAKELLGMQRLTNKQTVYISIPKKDYVEHRAEEVIIEEEEKGFFESIVDKIKNIF